MEMKGEQKIQKGTAENVTINNPYWSFNIVILSTAFGSVMTRENSANNSGDNFMMVTESIKQNLIAWITKQPCQQNHLLQIG